jgi:arsenate reductase
MPPNFAADQPVRLRPLLPATPAWDAFQAALIAAALPTADLGEPGQEFFILDEASPFGGYLIAGSHALLRSIAVPVPEQLRGVGRRLVAALLGRLADHGVTQVWLLTTSAGGFFERIGFVAVERTLAPDPIRTTSQFQGICPGSATLIPDFPDDRAIS